MGCFFIRKSPIRAVETGEMAESCDIARIGGYSRRNLQALYLEDDQRKRIRRGKKKVRKEKEDRGVELLRFEITTMGQFIFFRRGRTKQGESQDSENLL